MLLLKNNENKKLNISLFYHYIIHYICSLTFWYDLKLMCIKSVQRWCINSYFSSLITKQIYMHEKIIHKKLFFIHGKKVLLYIFMTKIVYLYRWDAVREPFFFTMCTIYPLKKQHIWIEKNILNTFFKKYILRVKHFNTNLR